MRNAERAGMMGVLGTQGCFSNAFFLGWCGGMKYCWKIFISNYSFRNKYIIILLYGILVDNNVF